MSDGYYYSSKKTDDVCEDVCGQNGSRAAKALSRVRCLLLGLDFKTYILFFTLVPLLIFGAYLHGQKFTYFLRPLWQSPPKPFQTIPHYHHVNVSMQTLCALHGWTHRDSPRRVFDAVLFSNEVDMLTIRWKDLHPYVTQFVILESNSTFTGLPKPLVFAANRENFGFVEPRLTYGSIGGRFRRGENPFVEEAYQRIALDQLIRLAGIQEDDLLIMSDVDEIPSSHTINLLRWCDGYPPVLHLQLKTTCTRLRGYVHRYIPGKTRYAHFRQGDAH
ncbi:unnamed protein product [Brassica napus]|uniref:(rape) hypothetical protein n=1 Tax=Brassica napus TaxID=3708 RepID=A0A816JUI9_BRANA|nr:unnamed protein product [Brassica napus]